MDTLLIGCEQCSRNYQLFGKIEFRIVGRQIIVIHPGIPEKITIYFQQLILKRNEQFLVIGCFNPDCGEKYLINDQGYFFKERPCRLHKQNKPKSNSKEKCFFCEIIQVDLHFSKCPKCENPMIFCSLFEKHIKCFFCRVSVCTKFKSFNEILPQNEKCIAISNKQVQREYILKILYLIIFSIFIGFKYVFDTITKKLDAIYIKTLNSIESCSCVVKSLVMMYLAIALVFLKYILIAIFWIPGICYQFYVRQKEAFTFQKNRELV